jgi:hypothetical protein
LAKTDKKKVTCLPCYFWLRIWGLAYIVSQGNIMATVLWFAITTDATAGLSYYREKEQLVMGE